MNHPLYYIGLLAIIPWGLVFGGYGLVFQLCCLACGIVNIGRIMFDWNF